MSKMGYAAYLEERITSLRTEAERCEEEDRWVDLHQEIDELELELKLHWGDLEEELVGWA